MKTVQKLDKAIATLISDADRQKSRLQKRGKITYREFLDDKMLMISSIRSGIPYSLFALIKDVTPFSESDWAEILSLSTRSLHRYEQASRSFEPPQSEKIVEMAEITEVGKEVFDSLEKFRLWLDTPNFALGSERPLDLLKDSYGKELVLNELRRIEFGIFA